MVSRRDALSIAFGATGAVLGGQSAQSQTLTSLSPPTSQVTSEFIYFDDPADEFRAQFRMGRDLVEDQGSTLTWYHWMVFVIPGGRRPEPLMRYEGIEYSYFRHLGNNNYRIHAHNVSFARDLKTNKFVDRITNPITDKQVDVPVSLLLHDPGTVGNPIGFRNLSGDGSYQKVYRQFRVEDSGFLFLLLSFFRDTRDQRRLSLGSDL